MTRNISKPYSCINFADKVKKSSVFQHLRIATVSWLDFTSGEFQISRDNHKELIMYYSSDGRQ